MIFINEFILIGALVILLSVVATKMLHNYAIPSLLIFIVLGILFGVDGIGKIEFNDYKLAGDICTIGLIFIMFYGGFGTSWKKTKPVLVPAVLMATFGVVITFLVTGLFCTYILKTSILEGLLIGAVVSSTDAASVFSIFRSKNVKLKGGLRPLLEMESGSNDPMAYLCTFIILTLMKGDPNVSILSILFKQIFFDLVIGFTLATICAVVLKFVKFELNGLNFIFVIGIALFSYSASKIIGGNGFLAAYTTGIILGNCKFTQKKVLQDQFDSLTLIMQIVIFFLLGLLSYPSMLGAVLTKSLLITICLLFIARPIATFVLLSWFNISLKKQVLISWCGLRGAASIVFAIFALNEGVALENDIFHIIFFVSLFSIMLQGTFLEKIAKKLNLTNDINRQKKETN